MALQLEFALLGPPISSQQNTPIGKTRLAAWRSAVARVAGLLWTNQLLLGQLKVVIINFYEGNKPSLDIDNMSKPIFDELQYIVYEDDRQIIQAELSHVKINAAFSIVGVSKVLVAALQAGLEFVYVRIEDPIDPFPLPK